MITRINQTTLRLCIDAPLIYPVAKQHRNRTEIFSDMRRMFNHADDLDNILFSIYFQSLEQRPIDNI